MEASNANATTVPDALRGLIVGKTKIRHELI